MKIMCPKKTKKQRRSIVKKAPCTAQKLKILRCPITRANCETLFSVFSFLHSFKNWPFLV